METYIVRIYQLGKKSTELVGTVQSAGGGPRSVFHGVDELWCRFGTPTNAWPKYPEDESDSESP